MLGICLITTNVVPLMDHQATAHRNRVFLQTGAHELGQFAQTGRPIVQIAERKIHDIEGMHVGIHETRHDELAMEPQDPGCPIDVFLGGRIITDVGQASLTNDHSRRFRARTRPDVAS